MNVKGLEVGGWGLDRPTPRIGCLPYLNVKPLVYPFEHGELPEGWELVYARPSELAGMLVDGAIDVAPVSSFAWIANPGFGYASGICIASDGPVLSVLMLSKKPIKEVASVAADVSSLSGRAYLQIVVAESYGIRPKFVDCEPVVDEMLSRCDAAFLIGDPAMLAEKSGLYVLDIGEEWKKLTGLPAVFALWAGPREKITSEISQELLQAKEKGIARVREIACEESKRLGLPVEACLEYLTQVICYDLGPRETESLRVFREKAVAHGLVERQEEMI